MDGPSPDGIVWDHMTPWQTQVTTKILREESHLRLEELTFTDCKGKVVSPFLLASMLARRLITADLAGSKQDRAAK